MTRWADWIVSGCSRPYVREILELVRERVVAVGEVKAFKTTLFTGGCKNTSIVPAMQANSLIRKAYKEAAEIYDVGKYDFCCEENCCKQCVGLVISSTQSLMWYHQKSLWL